MVKFAKQMSQRTQKLLRGDCREIVPKLLENVDLTFLDPPFNQRKSYVSCEDDLPERYYWNFISEISEKIFEKTKKGGAIYFMQREKNTGQVMQVLNETGWRLQNLIIWKKMTSAVPSNLRFGKSYQIIAFATKGKKPSVFNKLRINPPLLKNQKHERENGVFVTDIWDDIRELTSGYFAGEEAIRNENGERFHRQQSPLALLVRIILSSSKVGDMILDPFAGTGTTSVAANQLARRTISIEIDDENIECIKHRLTKRRKADLIEKYFESYKFTNNLSEVWSDNSIHRNREKDKDHQEALFLI